MSKFKELHPKPTYTATNSESYKSYLFRLGIWQTEKSIWYEALKWAYRQEDAADIFDEINELEKET